MPRKNSPLLSPSDHEMDDEKAASKDQIDKIEEIKCDESIDNE
jgi:hypothetical protein